MKAISLYPFTPERAYFLGLFSADGNVTRNKNGSWYVELTLKDRYLIEFTITPFKIKIMVT